jgi:hypothetical protein
MLCFAGVISSSSSPILNHFERRKRMSQLNEILIALALVLLAIEIVCRAFDRSLFRLCAAHFLQSIITAWDWFDLIFQTKFTAQVEENNGNVAVIKISNRDTIEIFRRDENLSVDDFIVKYAIGRSFPARATLQPPSSKEVIRHHERWTR